LPVVTDRRRSDHITPAPGGEGRLHGEGFGKRA
jgi:hypothetical protein